MLKKASIINPVIYLYKNDIHLKALYRANAMQLTEKGWMLDQATRWHADGRRTDLGRSVLPTGLDALDLKQSGLLPQSISVYLLPSFISSLERAGIPAGQYRFHLFKTLSIPLLNGGNCHACSSDHLNQYVAGHRSRLFLRGVLLAIVIFIFSYFMQVLGSSLKNTNVCCRVDPCTVVSLSAPLFLLELTKADLKSDSFWGIFAFRIVEDIVT